MKDPGAYTQVQGPLFSSDPLLNCTCLDSVVSSPVSKNAELQKVFMLCTIDKSDGLDSNPF